MVFTKKWFYAAGIRALKTFAQAAISAIGTTALTLSEINWTIVVSTACVSAILSLLMSVAGLPEVDVGQTEQ